MAVDPNKLGPLEHFNVLLNSGQVIKDAEKSQRDNTLLSAVLIIGGIGMILGMFLIVWGEHPLSIGGQWMAVTIVCLDSIVAVSALAFGVFKANRTYQNSKILSKDLSSPDVPGRLMDSMFRS